MSQINNYKTGSVRKTNVEKPESPEVIEFTRDVNYTFNDNKRLIGYNRKD